MASPRIVIRPVREDDAPQLQRLADLLDTVNLPDDPTAIAKIISDSRRSFAAEEHRHAAYTLVAVERDDAGGERVLGTGSLFAFHGMPDEPHYYLRIVEATVHSKQLDTDRRRTLLRLGRDIEPWTELGGLVVHPDARGKGIGKLLVAARLLLVAMQPTRFCRRLLAELLPPRREDGSNAFWDAIGGPLTGLEYYRADLLCRTDKEFIEALFPHEEIVVDLLPKEARELIGIEGPATAPVRALLRRAGFAFLGTIDPFDAGPHDGAAVDDIGPVKRARRLVRLDLPPADDAGAVELVAEPREHLFTAGRVATAGHGARIDDDAARALGLAAGDECWATPLDW